ncbi:MAG TPA: molybdopterin molybdenumtransferase MoeA, partial [Candidatus Kapabacteria bacterium]|nr:molybdopterin molybdenumtransferase MoeA [Candidatus Kapabacteria bacterium]
MISYESALKKVLSHAHRTAVVSVPVNRALGYALAEKIRAKKPVPGFDSSAVDGFAVNAKDIAHASERSPAVLRLQYVIRAGDQPGEALGKRSAIKIFTGAPVPPGADAIVMKEHVLEGAEEIKILRKGLPESGIRRQGAEFGKGTVVFPVGTLITPPVIGMLATLGYSAVRVFKRPRVAVIVTGNELRPLSVRLKP